MLRRVFKILLCMVVALNVTFAPAAETEPTKMSPVVNVKYIHDAILAKWNVSVGYNSALTNKSVAANMKYLLAAIDVANKKIGGSSKVYSGTSYATSYAVNKRTADNAIKNLIKKPRTFPFTATTTSDTTSFGFSISAAGEFWVDWGDGSDVQVITKTDTTDQTISHKYTTAGTYDIKIGGLTTKYSTSLGVINFRSNTNLAGISGSLGAIFPTLADGSNPSFYNTFYDCFNLTGSIPENLFAGIHGAPVSNMFLNTFNGCRGLTGSIPENLFAGIKGAPASYMFNSTFNGCRGLTGSIPEKLFAGISGAPAYRMFNGTFFGCSRLTGSIPENLFAGIKGAPASYMFYGTFSDCRGLTGSIPEKLFAGISGAPASAMFYGTFSGCRGLTGSIPENLFAGVSGAPASSMFFSTFYGCSGLTGSIPENLFAGISGAPAYAMFSSTFSDCVGLTSIPENLFAGVSGAPASDMFRNTFYGCSGLTGEIPLGLFGNLSGAPASGMFNYTFYNCKGLTGKSARNPDGTYLYDVFPSATSSQVGGMYTGTCLYDNASIPSTWGGATCTYVEPEPEYPFELTTTSSTTSYSFKISAAGTFYVNWGDGSTYEKITKNDTTTQTISHTYANKGAYTVKLAGRATAYSTNASTAAISFAEPYDEDSEYYKLASISGSLGEIFPTLTDGSQPRFYQTFLYCHNLSSNIPENLFSGISGAPVSSMFEGTFSGCTQLAGEIPENLFSGISGAPVSSMFSSTFYNCRSLTGDIPAGLFAGIKGAPAVHMFNSTFAGCTGLTGLGGVLFAGVSGAPAEGMYATTFGYNSFSGEIPLGLFGNLSGSPAASMFSNALMASGKGQLVGKSARNPDGTYLYDVFPSATSSQVGNMYTGTCLYDNASIPSTWGGKACTYTGPIPPDEVTDFPFSVTTVPNASEFALMLGATGDFTIDWGDGNVETVSPTNRTVKTHTYSNAGTYTIKLAGLATGKAASSQTTRAAEIGPWSVISFSEEDTGTKCNIASMSGSLGKIFPMTWTDGGSPTFMATFAGCANLTNISETLFEGVASSSYESMFTGTFAETGITEIPAGLFAGINGIASEQMFVETFMECTKLTSIPKGLFDGITIDKYVWNGFIETFYGCTALTGPSAQMSDGTYLYNIENFDENIGAYMYTGCTGLSDYATMPEYLKSAIDSGK